MPATRRAPHGIAASRRPALRHATRMATVWGRGWEDASFIRRAIAKSVPQSGERLPLLIGDGLFASGCSVLLLAICLWAWYNHRVLTLSLSSLRPTSREPRTIYDARWSMRHGLLTGTSTRCDGAWSMDTGLHSPPPDHRDCTNRHTRYTRQLLQTRPVVIVYRTGDESTRGTSATSRVRHLRTVGLIRDYRFLKVQRRGPPVGALNTSIVPVYCNSLYH